MVNADDGWARRLIREGTPTDTVTVSAAGRSDASWRAEGVRAAPDGGQRFVAVAPDGSRVPVTLPVPGAFMVLTVLSFNWLGRGLHAVYDPRRGVL